MACTRVGAYCIRPIACLAAVCETIMQHLRGAVAVCEMTMHHLHSVAAVCETTMQHLHSVAAVCETTTQHLRGPVAVCETTMQHLRSLFIVYEMITQGLHGLFTVCARPFSCPSGRRGAYAIRPYMYPAKLRCPRRGRMRYAPTCIRQTSLPPQGPPLPGYNHLAPGTRQTWQASLMPPPNY